MSRNRQKVICDLCQVECTGEGFFIAPDKSEFICILVRQCPECGRLVPAAGERYLSDKQRNFLLQVNEQGRVPGPSAEQRRRERVAAVAAEADEKARISDLIERHQSG